MSLPALKLRFPSREHAVADSASLTAEEESLAAAEAALSARVAELGRREAESTRALDEQRRALGQFERSELAPEVEQAMKTAPVFASVADSVLRERARANEARQAAIAARRAALVAEEGDLARREQAVSGATEAVAKLQSVFQSLRARAVELERAAQQRAAQERAANEARQAAVAPAVRSAPQPLPARLPPPPRAAAPVAPPAHGERRRSQRARLTTDIDLYSDSNVYTGFSEDFSDGGVFVATTAELPPGTEVDLAFTLPGDTRIEVRGVVQWLREYNGSTPDVLPGMGIAFTSLAPDARAQLQAFAIIRTPLFWA